MKNIEEILKEMMEKEKFYCRKCGARLIPSLHIRQFCLKTGKTDNTYKWECQNKKWYSFTQHTILYSDESLSLVFEYEEWR